MIKPPLSGRLCYLRLEAPAAETVETQVAAVKANVAAVVADLDAIMADVTVVSERCLGLGSNSGEKEANGE
jgi:hypothetical protein